MDITSNTYKNLNDIYIYPVWEKVKLYKVTIAATAGITKDGKDQTQYVYPGQSFTFTKEFTKTVKLNTTPTTFGNFPTVTKDSGKSVFAGFTASGITGTYTLLKLNSAKTKLEPHNYSSGNDGGLFEGTKYKFTITPTKDFSISLTALTQAITVSPSHTCPSIFSFMIPICVWQTSSPTDTST